MRTAFLGVCLGMSWACGPAREYLGSASQPVMQCTSGPMQSGIDVSDYQGNISWSSVSGAGITFAYAKATEGLTVADSDFAANWSGMQSAGVLRGAYHFFHPSDDGTMQADYFLAQTGQLGQAGDLPPMLDWEWDDCPNGPAQGICPGTASGDDMCYSVAQQIQSAQAFLTEVQSKTGVTPIIYTFPYFWGCLSAAADVSQFASYPLWIADYPSSAATTSIVPPSGECPDSEAPWTTWDIWQWSATGSVAGVSGQIDMDVFNGTLTQLQQLGGTSNPTSCPNGNGTYCSGDGYNGTANTLYNCSDGTFTVAMACPEACTGTPPGGSDQCGSAPIAQASGNDAITLVNWPDGHADVFVKTPAGAEEHASSVSDDNWSAPSAVDTGAECGSAAAFWGASWNYPELFSPLSAGATGTLTGSTSSWGLYQPFGGPASPQHLSATVTNDGRAEVFALGGDTAIWTNYWDSSSNAWAGWTSLGGTFSTGVGAITWGNGTVELFGADTSGLVQHMWSDMTGSANWSAWTPMGGPAMASRPVPVRWADGMDGHAEIFARGTDGHLYHSDFSYQTDWPAMSIVDSTTPLIGGVSAIMNPGGQGATQGPEVFARNSSGQVVHLSWNGTAYSGFTLIGNQLSASDPFGWIRDDGTAEVFAIDTDGRLVSSWRDPNNGWTSWSVIGSGFDPCSTALSVTEPDAGTPPLTDAGQAGRDAGVSHMDGGSRVDAGEATDGGSESTAAAGCGCGSADGAWAGLGLLAVLPRRRSRQRLSASGCVPRAGAS